METRPATEPLPNPEEQPTVDLWPTAARAWGMGRSAAYEAAGRGEIPGLIKIGRRYRVATAALRRSLDLDAGPGSAA